MSSSYEVETDFAFLGRTFTEYCRLFGLDPSALAGESVLDCPGGPSSFTPVAATITDRALAVDPAYGPPVDRLDAAVTDAVERTVAQLRDKRELFVWDEYGDVETRGRYLRAAAERFLADYARHPGRYLAAALPSLPLPSGAVDLVLSANLLFLYDDRLDEEFHVAAVRELARVADREVRLFPLHALDFERSSLVDPVVGAAREMGLTVQFEPVPYEFQPGATEALVVTGVDAVG